MTVSADTFTVSEVIGPTDNSFDLLVFAIGYELRSRFVPTQIISRCNAGVGIRFGSHEEASFASNLEWAESQPGVAVVMACDEVSARRELRTALDTAFGTGDAPIRIAVDASSLSRFLIALTLTELLERSRSRELDVRLLYAPAAFAPPPEDAGPVVTFGPVLDELTGIGDIQRGGLALVMGLGYEPNLALAAYQELDPVEAWLACPCGVENRYDDAVKSANRSLIPMVDDACVVPYRVDRPFDAFIKLENLVAGLLNDSTVVLLPFGPKIFATVMMLVALLHSPEVGVWRVSAEDLAPAADKDAAGSIFALDVSFARVTSK